MKKLLALYCGIALLLSAGASGAETNEANSLKMQIENQLVANAFLADCLENEVKQVRMILYEELAYWNTESERETGNESSSRLPGDGYLAFVIKDADGKVLPINPEILMPVIRQFSLEKVKTTIWRKLKECDDVDETILKIRYTDFMFGRIVADLMLYSRENYESSLDSLKVKNMELTEGLNKTRAAREELEEEINRRKSGEQAKK